MTACSAFVALQAVAMILRELEIPKVIDYGPKSSRKSERRMAIDMLHNRDRKSFLSQAKELWQTTPLQMVVLTNQIPRLHLWALCQKKSYQRDQELNNKPTISCFVR